MLSKLSPHLLQVSLCCSSLCWFNLLSSAKLLPHSSQYISSFLASGLGFIFISGFWIVGPGGPGGALADVVVLADVGVITDVVVLADVGVLTDVVLADVGVLTDVVLADVGVLTDVDDLTAAEPVLGPGGAFCKALEIDDENLFTDDDDDDLGESMDVILVVDGRPVAVTDGEMCLVMGDGIGVSLMFFGRFRGRLSSIT